MQEKKNPKKNMNRWSLIFFQIGLIIALLISWGAIQSRTYDRKDKNDKPVEIKYTDLEPEDVEVVEHPQTNTPPPPAPPKVPDKIKIVENDEDVEEDEVETVEDIEEPKVEVADISEIQSAPADEGHEKIEEVPFRAIQDVPVFPGCEKYKSNAERKSCMEEKVRKFVNKRFNTDLGRDLGLSGITRINVQFTVDEHGDITNVKARATEPPLEDEAKRVVKMLPKMTPGKQRGKAVRVIYTLPIAFKVN